MATSATYRVTRQASLSPLYDDTREERLWVVLLAVRNQMRVFAPPYMRFVTGSTVIEICFASWPGFVVRTGVDFLGMFSIGGEPKSITILDANDSNSVKIQDRPEDPDPELHKINSQPKPNPVQLSLPFYWSLTFDAEVTKTTRQLINGLAGISNKSSVSILNNKYFSPSVTLSMFGRNEIDEDCEGSHMGINRMNESNKDGPNDNEMLNTQWQNPVSWMNAPPGGLIGEALCLENATTTKRDSSSPTPNGHGYRNSSSNCSKRYC
ncbi:Hypothetical predicted protein [Olea europaea subsp. europaea]|uniref:Uncharacterized protein n=1 Tax=Olea europaea subsp. europaea TaxID=158383 RepID=A0A8S0RXM4_OLEEU|nr:Hypothetical predicted protein [Olea europaea subsp. europaea]